MFSSLKNWFATNTNKAKSKWNNSSKTTKAVIITSLAIGLGCGKFLKDIGTKMFFMTGLFSPYLSSTTAGVVFNDIIAVTVVAGIFYTNYLTSYKSLKYKLSKNLKHLKVDDSLSRASDEITSADPECPLILPRDLHIQADIEIREDSNNSDENSDANDNDSPTLGGKIKNGIYASSLHIIASTRLFFVTCDTYLGINKLYSEIAGLFGKTIDKNVLNKLTNTSGTYFAFSDGIMYCAYAYRLLLANGYRMRQSFTLDNIKAANKSKLVFASLFASLGILTKGLKDCFTISTSLAYVPLIKKLPEEELTDLGYVGGASSIAAKSIFEGLELGYLLYNPTPFLQELKTLTQDSKLTYLKLTAFGLNSFAEAAGGYQALEWLFDKTHLKEKLEEAGCLNAVQIPCGIAVALSVAALEFAFNVRSLSENAKHDAELRNDHLSEVFQGSGSQSESLGQGLYFAYGSIEGVQQPDDPALMQSYDIAYSGDDSSLEHQVVFKA